MVRSAEVERSEAGKAALVALQAARAESARAAASVIEAREQTAESQAHRRALQLAHQVRDQLELAGDPTTVAAIELAPVSGVVHLPSDRIIHSSAPHTLGSTLSASLPHLAAALRAATDPNVPLTVALADGHWAVGPSIGDGLRPIVQVAPVSPVAPGVALDQVAGALTSAAAPPPTPPATDRFSRLRVGFALLGSILGALLAALWAWARITHPLDSALAAARRFAHGEADARADTDAGAPEVRAVARTLNAVADEASRARGGAEAATAEAALALGSALATMGSGELCARAPEVPEVLQPVANGFETARNGIRDRVLAVHDLALEVAESAALLIGGARQLGRSGEAQVASLDRMSSEVTDAADGMRQSEVALQGALEGLSDVAAANRRGAQQMRASLAIAGRRATDLFNSAEQLGTRVEGVDTIEEALDLLDTFARSSVQDESEIQVIRARAAACVRRGRTAWEILRREVLGLRDELEDVAQSLEQMKRDVLEPRAEVDTTITGTLHDVAVRLVSASQRVLDGLQAFERSARHMQGGLQAVLDGAEHSASMAPRLSAALAELDLGDRPERNLIERLESVRSQLAEAAAIDELSPSARAIADSVTQAAEASRSRLGRLIDATEATAETLRNA